MEYWNANVQGIRQVFDIKRYFIIHETRANSAECEIKRIKIWIELFSMQSNIFYQGIDA